MEDNQRVWLLTFLFGGGILLIFISLGLIINEIYGASHFCKENDGDWSLNIKNNSLQHTCNDKIIVRYDDSWAFYQNFSINYSDLKYNYPRN